MLFRLDGLSAFGKVLVRFVGTKGNSGFDAEGCFMLNCAALQVRKHRMGSKD
jgi:hypothetical protein